MWNLWKDRNSLVFSRKSDLGGSLSLAIKSQVRFIVKEVSNASPLYVEQPQKEVSVAWKPPDEGVVKVNVVIVALCGKASCGGLARDCKGKFIKAFLCNVGFCNAIWAELWALRLGINLARELALSRVIFEMDSSVVVHMVHYGETPSCFLQPLLQEILSLLQLPGWETSVTHTYREAISKLIFLHI